MSTIQTEEENLLDPKVNKGVGISCNPKFASKLNSWVAQTNHLEGLFKVSLLQAQLCMKTQLGDCVNQGKKWVKLAYTMVLVTWK